MVFSYKQTVQLLESVIDNQGRLSATADDNIMSNKFKFRPYGIIVQDSFNNPFFSIQPRPQLDTYKLDLVDVFRRFREKYHKSNILIMLPWHYCIEMVGNRYYVFNTRPLDMKFPIDNNEVKDKFYDKLNDDAKRFIDHGLFDISEAIHVCIIGDTNRDIYPKHQYRVLAQFCLQPFVRFFRLPTGLLERIIPLNLGDKYNLEFVSKFIRK